MDATKTMFIALPKKIMQLCSAREILYQLENLIIRIIFSTLFAGGGGAYRE